MNSIVGNIREQFPALEKLVNGQKLTYLDSAATTLKPSAVIERITQFYKYETANVHRGAYSLSDQATKHYEDSREAVKNFINAKSTNEIIFTSGTTDAINLVAQSYGRSSLRAGDEIILTEMEHHSNIVPWQLLAKENQLTIRWIPVTDAGELDFQAFQKMLNTKTKLVSITHCSNALGTVNDIKKYIDAAHSVTAKVLIDAAQSVTTQSLDVQKLGCDFLVFSSHKMYGPYGVGILFGKEELLNEMPPWRGGGAMIAEVTTSGSTYLNAPQRFEAGTPNISGVIGLREAIRFIESLGQDKILNHEKLLHNYAVKKLSDIEGIRFIGTSASRFNILSFIIHKIHVSDIAQILDQQGVAIRAGHHCTQPLMKRYDITGTVRASFGVHNNVEDVDRLYSALLKAKEMLT
jgi:cysteine desulfurase / selenocysteine lyase